MMPQPRIRKHAQHRLRQFVAAVFYVLRTGVAWADLPAAFGKHEVIRQRFQRWCKRGVWQSVFAATLDPGEFGKVLLDGTICKTRRWAAGARGQAEEDIGRSRGGLTTKIGAAVDGVWQKIINLVRAPGQRHESGLAVGMLGSVEGVTVIADRAFDADGFRDVLAGRGCTAVIPAKKNRRNPFKLNREAYRWRHVIENVFARLKDFVRITLRKDKTTASYLGFLHFAAAVLNHRQSVRNAGRP